MAKFTVLLSFIVLIQGCGPSTMPATGPVHTDNSQLVTPSVPALVKALSDPSNDVRAQAAAALRPILAADPSLAPNWHDQAYWMKRIEKTKPDMLLKDALAAVLPDLSEEERERTLRAGAWSGGTGVSSYQLDDYWQVLFSLKDVGHEKLIEAPKLEAYARPTWVKPADDFTGLWATWHVNGQKVNEIEYRNGKYDGTFTAYYDDGSKCFQQHYKQHVCDGTDSGWFRSGKKMYEGQYKEGKQDGTWRHWYENGQMSTETSYKDGKQEGSSTTWLENGQKRYEEHYRDGKKHGFDTAWDEKGKLLWQRVYNEGELVESK